MLMADTAYYARYIEVLRSFLSGPGSAAVLNARIDAAWKLCCFTSNKRSFPLRRSQNGLSTASSIKAELMIWSDASEGILLDLPTQG